jgi:hypothetical protein
LLPGSNLALFLSDEEILMKLRFAILPACLCLLASLTWADTLELKNGSVIKGVYMGGTQNEISFQVGSTLQKYSLSDVESLKIDADGANAPAAGTPEVPPAPATAQPAPTASEPSSSEPSSSNEGFGTRPGIEDQRREGQLQKSGRHVNHLRVLLLTLKVRVHPGSGDGGDARQRLKHDRAVGLQHDQRPRFAHGAADFLNQQRLHIREKSQTPVGIHDKGGPYVEIRFAFHVEPAASEKSQRPSGGVFEGGDTGIILLKDQRLFVKVLADAKLLHAFGQAADETLLLLKRLFERAVQGFQGIPPAFHFTGPGTGRPCDYISHVASPHL